MRATDSAIAIYGAGAPGSFSEPGSCVAPPRTDPVQKLSPAPLQKERSPGFRPGSVWFRVPKAALARTRRPRWWVGLGRSYGVRHYVVYYGELVGRASEQRSMQKLAQKSALRRRAMAQVRQDPAEVLGGKALGVSFGASQRSRQRKRTRGLHDNYVRHGFPQPQPQLRKRLRCHRLTKRLMTQALCRTATNTTMHRR